MKTLLVILGIAGLLVGWGLFGAQQAKKAEYDCRVRLESLCFIWEKNALGKAKDKVHDLVDQVTR